MSFLHRKKFDLKSKFYFLKKNYNYLWGIKETIPNLVKSLKLCFYYLLKREKIEYRSKMPLTEELIYFINHFDGKKLEIANADHAIEVLRILEKASQSLQM